MPKVKRGPKRKRAKSRDAGALPAIGLFASALGNILQAADRAGLKKERDYLLSVIDDWQAAYARLQARNQQAEKEVLESRFTIQGLESQVRELERRLKDARNAAEKAQAEVLRLSRSSS